MAGRRSTPELFVTEAELAREHHSTPTEWKAKAAVLERDGFPRREPIIGLRYRRAVLAWWDRRHGLTAVEAMTPDGTENLNAL